MIHIANFKYHKTNNFTSYIIVYGLFLKRLKPQSIQKIHIKIKAFLMKTNFLSRPCHEITKSCNDSDDKSILIL